MGKICTVAIDEGGTGKTPVAAHLAFLSAERGAGTLLFDLDAQGNATGHRDHGSCRPAAHSSGFRKVEAVMRRAGEIQFVTADGKLRMQFSATAKKQLAKILDG